MSATVVYSDLSDSDDVDSNWVTSFALRVKGENSALAREALRHFTQFAQALCMPTPIIAALALRDNNRGKQRHDSSAPNHISQYGLFRAG
jgi:hypothetical protein